MTIETAMWFALGFLVAAVLLVMLGAGIAEQTGLAGAAMRAGAVARVVPLGHVSAEIRRAVRG